MRLANKTFFYSVIIALIVGIAIFAYMLLLMPSMYMDYKQKENLNYAKKAMRSLAENGKPENLSGNDSTAIGMVIPNRGNKIKVLSGGFEGEILLPEGSGSELLGKVRDMRDLKNLKDPDRFAKEFEPLVKKMMKEYRKIFSKKFRINIKTKNNIEQFSTEQEMIHRLGKGIGLGEFSVENRSTGTKYTTFVGIANKKNAVYLLIMGTITPRATEIRPVMVRAIPMIILMMILLAFGVSALYSRKIVDPVKKLSMDAEKRMSADIRNFTPIEIDGKDEIADLAGTLNLLYERQAENFRKLEEESRRKEVFMNASSHQLKTPIAASLLLVEGMTSKVGKFSDRDKYLPKVKEELQEMRKIVDEVMNLNYLTKNKELSYVDMFALCEEVVYKNNINADSKGITLKFTGADDSDATPPEWYASRDMLEQVIHNLVSNGIDHTDKGGEVEIRVVKDRLTVANRPAHIDKNIMDSVFEPFVSGVKREEEKKKRHGLGLYVARYFAENMGYELNAENMDDGVRFILVKAETCCSGMEEKND